MPNIPQQSAQSAVPATSQTNPPGALTRLGSRISDHLLQVVPLLMAASLFAIAAIGLFEGSSAEGLDAFVLAGLILGFIAVFEDRMEGPQDLSRGKLNLGRRLRQASKELAKKDFRVL